jgi:LmbE family N-acetylglucosaminyl deacetylase
VKTLIVAVHPDDETLGCGGTLLKHKAAGDEQHWMIVTEAMPGHPAHGRRPGQIAEVSQRYGFAGVHELRFPTTRLDTVPTGDLVGAMAGVLNAVRPEVLYLPFSNDAHSDHRVAAAAALSCAKSFRFPYLRKILMMETVSETEFAASVSGSTFAPNVLVDISPYLEEKLDIATVYGDEIGQHPFPRSLENLRALATFRGATAGCRYAEGFVLVREVA